MTSLKYFLTSLIVLTSVSSFAGGGGGGGVLASVAQVNLGNGYGDLKTEMVRFVGMDRADMAFEYGQVNTKNELYTLNFKARAEELSSQSQAVLNAIEVSRQTGEWAELK